MSTDQPIQPILDRSKHTPALAIHDMCHPIIVTDKSGAELAGIFEGYGPLKDQCSVLVPNVDGFGNRRIYTTLTKVRPAPAVDAIPAEPTTADVTPPASPEASAPAMPSPSIDEKLKAAEERAAAAEAEAAAAFAELEKLKAPPPPPEKA